MQFICNYPAKLELNWKENLMNENIFPSVAIFLLALSFFGISYSFFRKEQYKKALYLIILGGFLLRLFCSLDPGLHPWDERFHALVAKNMTEAPLEPKLYPEALLEYDYKNWAKNHVWLHKQPLPFWVMGASIKLFGTNVFALRLPTLLLSALLIGLTFGIASRLFNARVGVLAAFFHAINGLIIEIGSGRVATDHLDLFFFFFIELAIFIAVLHRNKKRVLNLIMIGAFTGFALLSKWLPGLIVIPVYLFLNYEPKKWKPLISSTALILIIALLVSLPWQVYAASMWPKEYWWENAYNLLHFNSALEDQGKPWWYHFENMGRIWNELIFVVLPWFIWRTWQSKSRNVNLALLVWIFLPYLFFSIASTKMQGYVLFTGPAFFILLSLFITEWCFNENRKPKTGNTWLPKLISVIIILLSVRFAVERVKPFEIPDQNERVEGQLLLIDNNVRGLGPHFVFNTPEYIDLMFFSDHIAYEKIPSEEEIAYLVSKGKSVVIIDEGNLPDYVTQNESIQKIQFNPE